MPYSRLEPDRILATAETLHLRVASRFPSRGIASVAAEVVSVTRLTIEEASALAAPLWWLRALILAIILAGAALFVLVGNIISLNRLSTDAVGSVQSIEAAINAAVLAGLGLAALVQLESRIKRYRVRQGLHRLRAVIRVIDMHQLTKDPATLSSGYVPNAQSPLRALSEPELLRYLDYCSELLSLTGKLAALYAPR